MLSFVLGCLRPAANMVCPDSMVVFGAVWIFPIKIASHFGRLGKYIRHGPPFFKESISHDLFEWQVDQV